MTLKIIALILCIVSMFWIVIKIALRNRDRQSGGLSVDEHPGFFKKPDIEMVNSVPPKDEQTEISDKARDD